MTKFIELASAKLVVEDVLDLYPSEYDKVFSKMDEVAVDRLIHLDSCLTARDALVTHLNGLLEGMGTSSDAAESRALLESVKEIVVTLFSKLEEG